MTNMVRQFAIHNTMTYEKHDLMLDTTGNLEHNLVGRMTQPYFGTIALVEQHIVVCMYIV